MARVDLSTLDRMVLTGDEDCGVGLGCLDCNRGGLPIAYYDVHHGLWPYRGQEVAEVNSIQALVLAAYTHVTSVHGAARAEA